MKVLGLSGKVLKRRPEESNLALLIYLVFSLIQKISKINIVIDRTIQYECGDPNGTLE